jgi:hypothetical protein
MAWSVHDRIRESVILMVGELCAFLAPTDARVPHVINRLMAALSTPSEQVRCRRAHGTSLSVCVCVCVRVYAHAWAMCLSRPPPESVCAHA